MDRTVQIKIGGRLRTFNYSVGVMFDMTEKFGSIQQALTQLGNNDREGLEALRWFAVRLANDGELVRRDAGCRAAPMLEDKDISPRISPMEYEQIKKAVVDAVTLGYKRDTEDEEGEVDLGLAEINEKKTKERAKGAASTISA